MRNYSIRKTIKNNAGHELDKYADFMLRKQNHFYVIGSENEFNSFYNRTGRFLKEDEYCLLGFLNKDVQKQSRGGDSVFLDVPIVEEAIIYAYVCDSLRRLHYDPF